jgi:hypothetical protein
MARNIKGKGSNTDCHFAVLPCVVTMEEIIGFNKMVHMDEQDELDTGNINKEIFCNGKDRIFPYGPTMAYTGNQGPCYVTST